MIAVPTGIEAGLELLIEVNSFVLKARSLALRIMTRKLIREICSQEHVGQMVPTRATSMRATWVYLFRSQV